MWASAYTPPAWKESYTILLYKNKGEITDLTKYRPIALLNTLYKLWTKLQKRVLSDYAEEHSLLSSQQAGFRKERNTTQQLQLITSALEDARLTGQNLYALIVDFSSAFNMVDHTTLHNTLNTLHFPPDACMVIRDLYSDAHSRIRWDTTTSDPIPILRGTMQGDTLSPFLFLCYMEPLLRWLHVGGRGYQFGCLPQKAHRLLHHLSSAAYADDLIILTHTPSDLKTQADKLTHFCNWAHMPVNTDKTFATGILYRNVINSPYGRKCPTTQVAAQLTNQILIQNKYATFLPPTKPFTYLGVEITMTLDWRPQHAKTRKTALDKVNHLIHSKITRQQKAHILKTCIRSAINYTFTCTPYTQQDLHLLDRIITKAAKQIYNLPECFPSAIIHQDIDKGGLGFPSLTTEYTATNTNTLISSLHTHGRIGTITKAILQQQLARLGHIPHLKDKISYAKYCLRARQYAMAISLQQQSHIQTILNIQPPPALALCIQQLDPTNPQHPLFNKATQLTQHVMDLPIQTLTDLLDPPSANHPGTYIIDGHTLTKKFSNIQLRHLQALNHLATLLNSAPHDPGNPLPSKHPIKSKPKEDRCIHPDNLHLLTILSPPTLPTESDIPPTFRAMHSDQLLITSFFQPPPPPPAHHPPLPPIHPDPDGFNTPPTQTLPIQQHPITQTHSTFL